MEGLSRNSIASSTIYRFVVGSGKSTFSVHSALLAHHSPALEALVRSDFRESSEYTVEWEDIDADAFLSLWQFLYTGTYENPMVDPSLATRHLMQESHGQGPDEPDARHGEGSAEAQEQEEETTMDEAAVLPDQPPAEEEAHPAVPDHVAVVRPALQSLFRRTKKGLTRDQMWRDFQRLAEVEAPSSASSRKVEETVARHADVLIHHAQVYVLADRYIISPLMDISYSKLHACLVGLPLDTTTGPHEMVELLQFCFESPGPEKLRKLVVLYVACKAKKLWKCEGLRDLLEMNGEFAGSLMDMVMLRLN